MHHPGTSLSISQLLGSGDATPWRLAIVQRERVWEPARAAKLLDSLLRGYPIGALLLCRTEVPSHVLDADRTAIGARPGEWQLLDGQQRTWALAALFEGATGVEDTPDFYVRLALEDMPNVKVGRADDRIQQFICWEDRVLRPFEEDGEHEGGRAEWLAVARLGRAFRATDDVQLDRLARPGHEAELDRWLRAADPDFRGAGPATIPVAAQRIAHLIAAWRTPFIPVQHVSVTHPRDVLEVYTRANLEGVPTDGSDVFLAGVKTWWPQAEERLDALRGERTPLSRMRTLRLVARLASWNVREQDTIPLKVQTLEEGRGREVVEAMQAITSDEDAAARVRRTLAALIRPDVLGLAWWYVDPWLVDDVLGWAARRSGRFPAAGALEDAAAYLFWGSALRLHAVFGPGLARRTFRVAWAHRGGAFPLEALLAEAREINEDLAYGRLTVPRPFHGTPGEQAVVKRDIVNARARMFLSVAQRLPVTPGWEEPAYRIDWDHIYAQKLRGRLKWRPPAAARSCFHPHASAVGRAGNLMALDERLNRSLQDAAPRDKLQRLDQARADGSMLPAELFLDDAARAALLDVQRLLEKEERGTAKNRALLPERLARFVAAREDALWEAAARRFGRLDRVKAALWG